jgi:hypothetical protein
VGGNIYDVDMLTRHNQIKESGGESDCGCAGEVIVIGGEQGSAIATGAA